MILIFKLEEMPLTVQNKIDIIYLYGKKYIYACKMKGVSLTAQHFKKYIKKNCFNCISIVKHKEYSSVLYFVETIGI